MIGPNLRLFAHVHLDVIPSALINPNVKSLSNCLHMMWKIDSYISLDGEDRTKVTESDAIATS